MTETTLDPADPRPGNTRLSAARRRLEATGLSLLGAAVLFATTSWPTAGPLVGLAFAIMLTPAVVERWRAPIFGFLPGWILWLWLAHLPLHRFHWIAVLLLPPVLGISYFLAALFAGGLRRYTRAPAWVILPLAVGATEWLQPLINPGNFNLYGVGTYLFDWPTLIQAADLIGSRGLSVLWMIPFGALVELVRWRVDGAAASGPRRVLAGAGLSAAVVAALVGYGVVRSGSISSEPGPRVAIVQPSLDHGHELTRQVVAEQQRMTARWVAPGEADLIVWPENAILAPYEVTPEYQQVVRWLASSRKAPLLFGAQGFGPGGKRPSNTAFLVGPEGEVEGDYHKVVLFPFTERRVFPALETVWPWLHRQIIRLTLLAWRDAPDGWAPEEPKVFPAELAGESWRIWTPICYETCYPNLGRSARRQGAEFYVNLTSTGWLGWAPANAMLGASVLRAVEGRVGLVRAANTGVSGIISPTGEITDILIGVDHGRPELDSGALIARVHISHAPIPFYARWGAWIDPLSFILCMGTLVVAVAWRWWAARVGPAPARTRQEQQAS